MTAVTAAEVSSQLPRALVSIESVKDAVSKIISEVQSESLKALQRHALEFDGLKLVNFRVPTEKLSQALDELDEGLRQAIEISIERVRKVSEATLPKSVSIEVTPGGYVVEGNTASSISVSSLKSSTFSFSLLSSSH